MGKQAMWMATSSAHRGPSRLPDGSSALPWNRVPFHRKSTMTVIELAGRPTLEVEW